MRSVVLILLAISLSGCISESADIGRPPPVMLETPQLAIDASLHGSRDAAVRAELHRALTEIGDGDVQSVRVRIHARSPRHAEALRRRLLSLGVDPARLSTAPGRWPTDRLVLTRALAETAPCAAAISPISPDDPLPSLMSLAHCTQDNNLANMLVDPGDLVAPPRLTAEDGQFLVDGVEAWRKGRTQTLPSQDGSASGGGGGSGGGGSGGGGSGGGSGTVATGPASVPASVIPAASALLPAVPAPAAPALAGQ